MTLSKHTQFPEFHELSKEKSEAMIQDVHELMARHFPDSVADGVAGLTFALHAICIAYVLEGAFSLGVLKALGDTLSDPSTLTAEFYQRVKAVPVASSRAKGGA